MITNWSGKAFKPWLERCREIKVLSFASNGQELVDKVREHHPQVVLTDIKMPVLYGDEAAKLIKAEFPEIKIIAISSHDEEECLIESVMPAGVNGYLLKCFSKKELLVAID